MEICEDFPLMAAGDEIAPSGSSNLSHEKVVCEK